MKKHLAFTSLLLLTACGPTHVPYATRQDIATQMSDTQLCMAFAEDETAVQVKAEMAERQLDCADLLKSEKSEAFPVKTWRDDLDDMTRATTTVPPR
jgi:hypothetical protein